MKISKVEDPGYMPGERRKKANEDMRIISNKILNIKEGEAFFVLLGKGNDTLNFRILPNYTSNDEAMEKMRLHGHHHSGDSIHRFVNIDCLHNNPMFKTYS